VGVWPERGGTRVGDAVELEIPGGWLVGWLVMRDLAEDCRVHEARPGETVRVIHIVTTIPATSLTISSDV